MVRIGNMTLEERHDIERLKAECLALPQADRDALIEALQKPGRDWADEVWEKALKADGFAFPIEYASADAAAVIRSMCRPKEEN